MNIGTICYATPSGLGHLAKQFYDNDIINRIYVLPHPRYKDHSREWYKDSDRFSNRSILRADSFLHNLDAIIIFENVFNHWRLVDEAKKKGIKIILVPMYEWTPNPLPVEPDLVICPSLLDVRYFTKYPHIFLNIPVDRKQIKWRERTVANTFVHNAGHGQVGLTKGTPEVIEAWNHLNVPARLILRGQIAEPRVAELLDRVDNPNIEVHKGDLPYSTLFTTGDVYINAEQYNGLSLPLQEAFSSGMFVITTDRFPMNTWLPHRGLVEPYKITNHKLNHTTFERSHINPRDLAAKVEEIYGQSIVEESYLGRKWGDEHSYQMMTQTWVEEIANIVGTKVIT